MIKNEHLTVIDSNEDFKIWENKEFLSTETKSLLTGASRKSDEHKEKSGVVYTAKSDSSAEQSREVKNGHPEHHHKEVPQLKKYLEPTKVIFTLTVEQFTLIATALLQSLWRATLRPSVS